MMPWADSPAVPYVRPPPTSVAPFHPQPLLSSICCHSVLRSPYNGQERLHQRPSSVDLVEHNEEVYILDLELLKT